MRGQSCLFPSAVAARYDKMVELVTRMLELKKQQARAPKKQSPSARQLLDQKFAITDKQIDPSSGDTIKDYDKFRGHNKRLWMAAYLTLPARHDKMVEMVETMLKLHGDSSRLTADSREVQ